MLVYKSNQQWIYLLLSLGSLLLGIACEDLPSTFDDQDFAISNDLISTCGDGVVFESESCDDGNLDNEDGCDERCVLECGNGVLNEGEECDDGNLNNEDGCFNSCQIRIGGSRSS